jgi:hypothetical protein
MGDKISNLPNGTTPLSGTESVPVVQNGNTVKVVSSSFKTTNAADLTSGTVSTARLPIASNVSAGIVQLGSLTGQACDGADVRLSNARTPTGSAGGDLSGTYPNPQLAASGVSAGTFGAGSVVPVITVDAKGRLTNVAQASIPIPQAATTTPLPDGVASAGNSSSYARADHIHQASSTTLTGDVVGTGTGTVPTTLSNTGVSQGTYGSSNLVPVVTVDSKGRVLAVSEQPFSSTQGGTVTSVNVSGGSTGLTVSGGPITDAGTLSLGGTLAVASGGTGSTSAVSALANLGGVSSSLVGTVNGLATLDGGGKVPYAQLPGSLGSAQVATLDGNGKVPLVQLYAGMNNGLATLDAGGKVPTAQLPSYVDDVVEVANFAALPAVGELSVIYVTLDTNLTYRWTGSVYVEISAAPQPSSTTPLVDGVAAVGTSLAYARADHVHPSPTISNIDGGSPSVAGGSIQQRRGTAAQWTSANPVLPAGAFGYETDFLRVKVGDGTTAWNSLPYIVSEYQVDLLVVSGGGAGGGRAGGAGGGGGGVKQSTVNFNSGFEYTVTVGAGGAGSNPGPGSSGSASSLGTFASIGGGYGAGAAAAASGQYAGASGGSGGGGTADSSGTYAAGSGTSGQGFAGGSGATDHPSTYTYINAGGGGGAGAVGANATASSAGNGGVGVNWKSLGAFYGGGGGGGTTYSGTAKTAGTGGSGGGGNGVANTSSLPGNGTANTGGGGGGAASIWGNGGSTTVGGNGGSGVVVVRYFGPQRATGGTVTSSGGYTYHTFTSSGVFTA